jgi:MHS family proline/betaine transporter-like MFS transporter
MDIVPFHEQHHKYRKTKMNKTKLVFSSCIASIFEWYDYTLFGHFASIWAKQFFPSENMHSSMLNSFAVFAIGYLMRPMGGIVFGVIGDKFGRKIALSSSVMSMAIPTTIIGLLPTYTSIGVTATVMLVLARMLQGLSMGGALTGSMSFIIEHSPAKHRGLVGSIPMSSICIGILLGSLVSSITQWTLSVEDFESWGWRIPFLLGIFVMYAGLYIKRHTQETPMFTSIKTHDAILKSPLKVVFKKYWFDMIISILINSTGSVIFYLQAIYLINYLHIATSIESGAINYMVNISYIIMAIVTLLSGWLSDFFGRKKIYVILNVIIIVSIFSVMEMFQDGSVEGIWIAQIILSLMAAMYIGAEPALQAEFYPTNIRNTALSLSYNTATSLFGGTAPFVFHWLFYKTGMVTSAAYYIIICSVCSLGAMYFYKNRTERT